MTYVVGLRRNSDGLVREHEEPGDWDQVAEFMWSDGNYGCDCNRGLFFARAAGEDDPDRPCGMTLYAVAYVKTPDGTVVHSEDKK